MNERSQTAKFSDLLKWLFAFALIGLGVFGNYWYQDHSLLLRVIVLLALGVIALLTMARTTKGTLAVGFIQGARSELRKVVWPTRQETLQTSLIVVVMVTVMGLVLWGFDAIVLRTVAWLTGYGG